MDRGNNDLVHLQQGQVPFNDRGAFYQDRGFEDLGLVVYDPGARVAVILISIVGCLTGIVFGAVSLGVVVRSILSGNIWIN